jgi:ferric iron reductase protein FhuF
MNFSETSICRICNRSKRLCKESMESIGRHSDYEKGFKAGQKNPLTWILESVKKQARQEALEEVNKCSDCKICLKHHDEVCGFCQESIKKEVKP